MKNERLSDDTIICMRKIINMDGENIIGIEFDGGYDNFCYTEVKKEDLEIMRKLIEEAIIVLKIG